MYCDGMEELLVGSVYEHLSPYWEGEYLGGAGKFGGTLIINAQTKQIITKHTMNIIMRMEYI